MDDVIERCRVLPGQRRHTKLLELARRLRALEGFSWTQGALQDAVFAWNDRSHAPARGRDLAKLWPRFWHAWGALDRSRCVFLARLAAEARDEPVPRCAMRYRDQPELLALTQLCLALDDLAQGRPWPLSKRAAADAVGLSPSQALRLLRVLVNDDVLVRVSKGERGTCPRNGKRYVEAATFRFIGEQ